MPKPRYAVIIDGRKFGLARYAQVSRPFASPHAAFLWAQKHLRPEFRQPDGPAWGISSLNPQHKLALVPRDFFQDN